MRGIFSDSIRDNQFEFCVISDVHIANDSNSCKSSRNDYVFDDNNNPLSGEAFTLTKFCECLRESGKRDHFFDDRHMLILLGDIINGGECGYTDCYYSLAYQVLLSSLRPYLHAGNIIYIPGNHDKSAKFYSDVAQFPRLSVFETVVEQTRKERLFKKCGIIFEHGHKFDYLCSGKTLLGMMGDFASNVVVNLCSSNMEDVLRGRDFYYDHSSENSLRISPERTEIKTMNSECRRVANGALKCLSENRDCHTIVCGHTHQSPVRVTVFSGGREMTYFNTGKFAKDGWLDIKVERDGDSWRLSE